MTVDGFRMRPPVLEIAGMRRNYASILDVVTEVPERGVVPVMCAAEADTNR